MRKRTPDELISECPTRSDIEQIQRHPVHVIVDNVRSAHNVGSVFRTADSLLLGKIYLCGITGIPPLQEIRKASLGAEESVPWEYHKNAIDVVNKLKAAGYTIIALEQTDASIDLAKIHFKFPMCLVIGHEYHGVSDEVIRECDGAVEIPMFGIKVSLNVSVAFGIAAYEVINQYLSRKPI